MMKAMICEMCGGRDLVKQDGLYVCQHCGCKYSTEEARKLFEVTGKVEVDGISTCEQLLEKGNTYLKFEDYKSAQNAFKEFINTYPHKRIGYEKYFTALTENFSEYFACDLADSNTVAEVNDIIRKLAKIDDGRGTYDANVFMKKVNDYLDWIDLKEQQEQNENALNKLSEESLFWSKQIDSAKLTQKRSIIVFAVSLILGFYNLYEKSPLTVFIFIVAGISLLCFVEAKREVKTIPKRIDENCERKTEFEKKISNLNDKINKKEKSIGKGD
ncbi:MAG: TFIIB-type zinc finger domain-containing protein [Oscillospiraceae bacterium]|nr:TFIIB-type zinc finger domain-containing protein [Oscillospiraceae bacterium]